MTKVVWCGCFQGLMVRRELGSGTRLGVWGFIKRMELREED
jgi:hypothetical protein